MKERKKDDRKKERKKKKKKKKEEKRREGKKIYDFGLTELCFRVADKSSQTSPSLPALYKSA